MKNSKKKCGSSAEKAFTVESSQQEPTMGIYAFKSSSDRQHKENYEFLLKQFQFAQKLIPGFSTYGLYVCTRSMQVFSMENGELSFHEGEYFVAVCSWKSPELFGSAEEILREDADTILRCNLFAPMENIESCSSCCDDLAIVEEIQAMPRSKKSFSQMLFQCVMSKAAATKFHYSQFLQQSGESQLAHELVKEAAKDGFDEAIATISGDWTFLQTTMPVV